MLRVWKFTLCRSFRWKACSRLGRCVIDDETAYDKDAPWPSFVNSQSQDTTQRNRTRFCSANKRLSLQVSTPLRLNKKKPTPATACFRFHCHLHPAFLPSSSPFQLFIALPTKTLATSSMSFVQSCSLATFSKLSQSHSRFNPLLSLLWGNFHTFSLMASIFLPGMSPRPFRAWPQPVFLKFFLFPRELQLRQRFSSML